MVIIIMYLRWSNESLNYEWNEMNGCMNERGKINGFVLYQGAVNLLLSLMVLWFFDGISNKIS